MNSNINKIDQRNQNWSNLIISFQIKHINNKKKINHRILQNKDRFKFEENKAILMLNFFLHEAKLKNSQL